MSKVNSQVQTTKTSFYGLIWPQAIGYLFACLSAPLWIAVIRVSADSLPVIKSQGKGYSKCHSAEVLNVELP